MALVVVYEIHIYSARRSQSGPGGSASWGLSIINSHVYLFPHRVWRIDMQSSWDWIIPDALVFFLRWSGIHDGVEQTNPLTALLS